MYYTIVVTTDSDPLAGTTGSPWIRLTGEWGPSAVMNLDLPEGGIVPGRWVSALPLKRARHDSYDTQASAPAHEFSVPTGTN